MLIKESDREEPHNTTFTEGQWPSLFFPSHKTGFLLPILHDTSGLVMGRNPGEPGSAPSPALSQEGEKDLAAVTSTFADRDKTEVSVGVVGVVER